MRTQMHNVAKMVTRQNSKSGHKPGNQVYRGTVITRQKSRRQEHEDNKVNTRKFK